MLILCRIENGAVAAFATKNLFCFHKYLFTFSQFSGIITIQKGIIQEEQKRELFKQTQAQGNTTRSYIIEVEHDV